ncbi:MAG: hypothetical protein P8126_11605 [Gammaproteobacteria bacterium]
MRSTHDSQGSTITLWSGEGADEVIVTETDPISLVIHGEAGNDMINASVVETDLILTGDGGDDIIISGAGDDTVTGGSDNDTLVGGSGDDTLSGGAGDDLYVFADGWGNDTILEEAEEGDDTLDFSAVTAGLTIQLGSITVTDGTNSATHSGDNVEHVVSGSGGGTLVGPDSPNIWHITDHNAGDLNGTFLFSNVANLTGGADTDRFIFSDNRGMSGLIDGANGVNTLDYSPYSTRVEVDLSAGAATGTGTIANIRDVAGGSSHDYLVGDGQDNVLSGSAGDDDLVGGLGDDTLRGGEGHDILVADAGRILRAYNEDGSPRLAVQPGPGAGTKDFRSGSTGVDRGL